MKKIYIIILLFLGTVNGYSQDTTYFNPVENGKDGTLILYAKEAYQSLPAKEKQLAIIKALPKGTAFDLLLVHSGTKREMWIEDPKTSSLFLVDSMDMNNPYVRKNAGKLISHPFFIYFGGQTTFNSETVNFDFSTRFGFFLLLNRWDLALATSFGMRYGNPNYNYFVLNLGLASKYYFPIKKYPLTPYIGTSISYIFSLKDEWGASIPDFYNTTTTSTWDFSFLTGISWYIGPGSLDFGIQAGLVNHFATTIGYTFLLNSKNIKSRKSKN